MERTRLRDLGITIGNLPTGANNAISDVPGVWVGQTTLTHDEPRIARTGVTAIVPREGNIWKDNAFAGYFSFNGTGEMTGMHWLAESGLLCYPILITNTHHVGTVHEAVMAYGSEKGYAPKYSLPVVAETYDGWLNDSYAFHIERDHVYAAIETAKPGPVEEGNTGGGAGMICHGFKGGTGTASRLVNTPGGEYTLGVLVQANHGDRKDLRVDGVPIGSLLDERQIPSPWVGTPNSASSIIIVIATNAPLIPVQCKRLAKRATLGLARVGGMGYSGSGDIFLAFATGNHIECNAQKPHNLQMLPHDQMDIFFVAVVEAVEEAILNALTGAETMQGYKGHTVYALPLDALKSIMSESNKS